MRTIKFNQIFKKVLKFLKSKLVLALIIGMLIRITFAPFTEQRYDMYIWRFNQVLAYEYHINPFYPPEGIDQNATAFFWSYTPLWLFCLLPIYPVYKFFSNPSYPSNVSGLWEGMFTRLDGRIVYVNRGEAYHSLIPANLPLLDLLIKLPLILSDLLIGVLLFKIIKELTEEKKAHHYLWMWLLNPYVIFISSIWGMFDSIPTLFTLLAVWLFLKEKDDKSALSLGIAVLFKMYSLILIPILALICYKKKKSVIAAIKYSLISLGITLLVSFASYLSFAVIFGQEPLTTSTTLMWQLFKGRASPDWEGSNIFFGLTPLGSLDTVFNQLNITSNIPISPVLITLAIIVLSAGIYRKKSFSEKDVISYVVVAHLAIYLTYSVVNEQYLVWVLPFLLLLSAERKDSIMEYVYWTISLVALLFIFAHYKYMSYFISPCYVPGYPGYLPISVSFGIVATVLYLISIRLALKRKDD